MENEILIAIFKFFGVLWIAMSSILSLFVIYRILTGSVNIEKLSFDDWYDKEEENINNYLSQSGADMEMDFNPEKEFENRYNEYLNK
tara:strand:- start:156 stop:416 length:261 start_codon:yes stop_codon:yes gene_type:complete